MVYGVNILKKLHTEIAEVVQNNQELINNNSDATKSDIASVNAFLINIAN